MKQIRTACARDLPALAALSAKEYDSWSADDFRQTMGNPCAHIWVCEESEEAHSGESQILGYALLYYDEDGSELMQIAVLPERRREHVATLLLETVFGFLHDRRIPQIMLEVRAENDAAGAFYRKMGFRVNHIKKNFYRNPPDDAVKMIRKVTIC